MSIENLGAKRRRGRWKKGESGNPGGRPKIAEAWDKATGGKTTAQVAADALKLVYEVMMKGPRDARDPCWTFATQKVLEYTIGKPKEQVEVTGGITPEAQALLEALRLTPHERRMVIDAAAEDAAAMDELVDGDLS
jgi:hypothetical protein